MYEFHGFTVENKIGAGGMSTVYKGRHSTLGYAVAVKILHPGMSGDQEFIARFEREARAAAALNHPNIVNVIDFGSEDDVFFIIMQYVDGADLGKIFDEVVVQRDGARFPLEIALALVEEVAYGLVAAHKQGIIHRDIKPSNVMLSSTGHVKVADFGLARDIGDAGSKGDPELTMPGKVVGTPSYMSPEQAVGGKVDARTDIFSLGVMAFQLIVGRKPFAGDSALDVQEQIITADLPHLDTGTCPRYTPEIGHLLTKMLTKDPAHRFQTMEQTLRAVTAAAESIDPSGGVLKYKREYMTRFAEDPVAFSDELHATAISNYLKRGFHFKTMGLSAIDDAVREFHHVLSLDADHARARAELEELRKQAEESGITLAAGQDPTDDRATATAADLAPGFEATLVETPAAVRSGSQVGEEPAPEPVDEPVATPAEVAEVARVAEASTPEPEPEPASEPAVGALPADEPGPAAATPPRPSGANRIRIFVAAAVVVAAAAAALFWPRGDDADPRIADGGHNDEAVTEQVQEPVVPAPTADGGVGATADPDSAAALAARATMIAAKDDLGAADYDGFPAPARSFDQAERAAARAAEAFAAAQYANARAEFEAAGDLYAAAARSLDGERLRRRQDTAAEQELAALESTAAAARSKTNAARSAADRAGGEAKNSRLYSQARAITRQAEETFAAGDADGFRQASLLFAEATDGFEQAAERAATAAASTRAMQRSQAEAARQVMADARAGLADHGTDLAKRSARYGDAGAAAATAADEFDQGHYEAAKQQFETAAGLYVEAEPEIRQSLADEQRRAAIAEIDGMVADFFTNVGAGDYDRVRSQLNWEENRDWRDLIESAVALNGRESDVRLAADGRSATVKLKGALEYRIGGRMVEDPYLLDFTWRLQSTDRGWKIIGVQTK